MSIGILPGGPQGPTIEEILPEGVNDIPAFNTGNDNGNGLSSRDPMQDITENKNIIFQILLFGTAIKLSKTPGGLRVIEVLGKELIKGLFDTLDSFGQSAAANHVASWAGPVLVSGVLERLALLPPHFNNGFHKGITTISGVNVVTGIVNSILGEKGFPESLTFAKRTDAEHIAATAKLIRAKKGLKK